MGDNNYPPGDFAGRVGETIGPLNLVPPDEGRGFSDIFKNSGVQDCTFNDIWEESYLHSENGWDANKKTARNKYNRLTLCAGGGPAVYLKDGFCDNEVNGVTIKSYAKHSDWYEGDYSSTGGARNRGNTYSGVHRADGKAVRVAWTFFRAERPKFKDSGPIRYQWGWSLVRTIYVELKYLFPKLIP